MDCCGWDCQRFTLPPYLMDLGGSSSLRLSSSVDSEPVPPPFRVRGTSAWPRKSRLRVGACAPSPCPVQSGLSSVAWSATVTAHPPRRLYYSIYERAPPLRRLVAVALVSEVSSVLPKPQLLQNLLETLTKYGVPF